jgi:hypothetical protein
VFCVSNLEKHFGPENVQKSVFFTYFAINNIYTVI